MLAMLLGYDFSHYMHDLFRCICSSYYICRNCGLQVEVYEMGRTYLEFVRQLHLQKSIIGPLQIISCAFVCNYAFVALFMAGLYLLNVAFSPPPDPVIYIDRFASLLNLGTLHRRVVDPANRLVQAMSHDWMLVGRRPSGLCAAGRILHSPI